MKRWWFGLACLSASWPFALGYFGRQNWLAWLLLVGAAVVLLKNTFNITINFTYSLIIGLMSIPCLIFFPGPYMVIPLFFLLFALLQLLPLFKKQIQPYSSALITSAFLLLIQALVLGFYQSITARSHELPDFVAGVMQWVANLLGIEASAYSANLSLFSMRKVHLLGITWELILDPMSLLFLVSVLALLIFHWWSGSLEEPRRITKKVIYLLIVMLFWLPFKAGILIAGYLHRVLLTDYDKPLTQASMFWSQWLHLLLLLVPVMLCLRFITWPGTKQPAESPGPTGRSVSIAAASMFLACLLITMGFNWLPMGKEQGGRVMVDEYHSQAPWYGKDFDTTSTIKPFDTAWYGQESTYNYAGIYDYLGRFFHMSRNSKPIRPETLAGQDVLFLKVPSRPFDAAEISAIRRFVDNGGGLLLMGEHTNVFGSGTYLNHVAKPFGFRFRYDCLFGIDSVFEQYYRPPVFPHPIVSYIKWLDFAVSCSIEPLDRGGNAAIRSLGLKNLSANYHVSNYYPQPEDSAEMRYGAFVQLWASHFGQGRVAAFTDSTIFANFSAFEPGKMELMMGMINWLNHKGHSRLPMILGWLGIIILGFSLFKGFTNKQGLIFVLAAGMLGWTIAAMGLNLAKPQFPAAERPVPHAGIDRIISGASLPLNGFISGKEKEYGLLERAILRMGTFPHRNHKLLFKGSKLQVVIYPNRKPSASYIKKMKTFVQAGGNLLVVEAAENPESTANHLLQPFGISVNHGDIVAKASYQQGDSPAINIEKAVTLSGGTPVIKLGDKTVVAQAAFGKGQVMVMGIGYRFVDGSMGGSSDVVPDDQLKPVYALLHTLLGKLLD